MNGNGNAQPRHETVLDDTTRRIARVYAQALLDAATQRQQAAEVLDELNALVHDVLDRDPALEAFLTSPAVGRDRKEKVIKDAFGGRADEVFVNFLLVLNRHDRLEVIRAVAQEYRELYDERAGRLPVEVESAVPLASDQEERLRHELRARFKDREPVLTTRVNPDLLGGLVVRVGDWVYDASVRNRLALIRNQLIERSSHEIQRGGDRFSSRA
jgi:F-type H+-transporting ATPase subunit delta